jgi:hypothetical protein
MSSVCPRCHKEKEDVEDRYSYGIYAGRYCSECAYKVFRDHCGLVKDDRGNIVEGGEQGAVEVLDEFEIGGYDAIYGEE